MRFKLDYDRIRHILRFSATHMGWFGERWWHGTSTLALLAGCLCAALYIGKEYTGTPDAYMMVSENPWSSEVTIVCGATQYCRFISVDLARPAQLSEGENITIRASESLWLVELLTRTDYSVRRSGLALESDYSEQFFSPPVEQGILQKFTLSITNDYRETPPIEMWDIATWNDEWDTYPPCENANLTLNDVSYTCGAYELHFSTETYAKRYRRDIELANATVLVAGAWVVFFRWTWALVRALDLISRMERDL